MNLLSAQSEVGWTSAYFTLMRISLIAAALLAAINILQRSVDVKCKVRYAAVLSLAVVAGVEIGLVYFSGQAVSKTALYVLLPAISLALVFLSIQLHRERTLHSIAATTIVEAAEA